MSMAGNNPLLKLLFQFLLGEVLHIDLFYAVFVMLKK